MRDGAGNRDVQGESRASQSPLNLVFGTVLVFATKAESHCCHPHTGLTGVQMTFLSTEGGKSSVENDETTVKVRDSLTSETPPSTSPLWLILTIKRAHHTDVFMIFGLFLDGNSKIRHLVFA